VRAGQLAHGADWMGAARDDRRAARTRRGRSASGLAPHGSRPVTRSPVVASSLVGLPGLCLPDPCRFLGVAPVVQAGRQASGCGRRSAPVAVGAL
jgi:hypothetical protein